MLHLAVDTINRLPFFFFIGKCFKPWQVPRSEKDSLHKGSCCPSFVGGYPQMWSQTRWHTHLRESKKLETEG